MTVEYVALEGGRAIADLCGDYDDCTIAQWLIDSGLTRAALGSVRASVNKKRNPECSDEQFKFCEIYAITQMTQRDNAAAFLAGALGRELSGPVDPGAYRDRVRRQIHESEAALKALYALDDRLTRQVNGNPVERVLGHAFQGHQ